MTPLFHVAVAASLGMVTVACAGFQNFFDKPAWASQVPSFTALTFSEFDEDTWMTNQYVVHGVTFLNGDDDVDFGWETYPEDGWGIDANNDCHLIFDSDQFAIAVAHPGQMAIRLFNDNQIVYEFLFFPGGGYGFFGGVVGTEPFDEAVIFDFWDDQINIDDIYFAVPSPAAVALLGLGAAFHGRRRRSV